MLANSHEVEQNVFLRTETDVLSYLFIVGGNISTVDTGRAVRWRIDTRQDIDRRCLNETAVVTKSVHVRHLPTFPAPLCPSNAVI